MNISDRCLLSLVNYCVLGNLMELKNNREKCKMLLKYLL